MLFGTLKQPNWHLFSTRKDKTLSIDTAKIIFLIVTQFWFDFTDDNNQKAI